MKKLMMMNLAIFLTILAMVGVAPVVAQDIHSNSVGIYLADGSLSAEALQGQSLDLHLLVTNMDAFTLAGFELKIIADGPLFVLASTIVYPTAAINVATRENEYIVGFDGPVPAVDGSVEIMTFSAVVTDAAIASGLRIEPVFFSSLDDVPCFLVDAQTGELREMRQSAGGPADQVFVVNNPVIPVTTESTTFGSLKSLFR